MAHFARRNGIGKHIARMATAPSSATAGPAHLGRFVLLLFCVPVLVALFTLSSEDCWLCWSELYSSLGERVHLAAM